MREIKDIVEILSFSAIDHLKELLSKCDASFESIKLYSNRLFIIDSVLLQMFGYMEKKFQGYSLFIAMIDPNRRFHYYNKSHKIEFEFKDVFAEYKKALNASVDDKAKEIFYNNIKLKYGDLKSKMEQTFKMHYVWNDLEYNFNIFNNYTLFPTTNSNKQSKSVDNVSESFYNCIEKLFEVSYDYRNVLAHNLNFEYKNNTLGFDLLNEEVIYSNIIFYYFLVILIDDMINESHRNLNDKYLLTF